MLGNKGAYTPSHYVWIYFPIFLFVSLVVLLYLRGLYAEKFLDAHTSAEETKRVLIHESVLARCLSDSDGVVNLELVTDEHLRSCFEETPFEVTASLLATQRTARNFDLDAEKTAVAFYQQLVFLRFGETVGSGVVEVTLYE